MTTIKLRLDGDPKTILTSGVVVDGKELTSLLQTKTLFLKTTCGFIKDIGSRPNDPVALSFKCMDFYRNVPSDCLSTI